MTLFCEFDKNESGIFVLNSSFPLFIGTVARSSNNIDYNMDMDNIREKEIARLSHFCGIESRKIVMLNQVHGDSIIVIDKVGRDGNRIFHDADGMITNINKLCLVIRTADCVPVFAYDAGKGVIGAAHSGWRGCRLNISCKLVREMKTVYRSAYKDIHIFILPSIGPSYSINTDVAAFFKDDITIENNRIYLSLWENIERSLIKEGISKQNIYQTGICTYSNDDFFSSRRGDSGRNLNFGFINKE